MLFSGQSENVSQFVPSQTTHKNLKLYFGTAPTTHNEGQTVEIGHIWTEHSKSINVMQAWLLNGLYIVL